MGADGADGAGQVVYVTGNWGGAKSFDAESGGHAGDGAQPDAGRIVLSRPDEFGRETCRVSFPIEAVALFEQVG
ncbi:MAG: hypothetical protein R3C44_23405 [Chloroflexota bacterium]